MALTIELKAKLMGIFQNWSIQFICDYYEAERDLLGDYYINEVDASYNKETGQKLLEWYIQEYPEAFLNLIDCIKGKTADMPNPQDASDFAKWLMAEDRPENIRLIANALSKGFLCEWIVYHHRDKIEFVSLLKEIYLKDLHKEYDDWEFIYERKTKTRLEMAQEFEFRTDSLCYLYYKICRDNNLLTIFHAMNTPTLRLGNDFKVIKEDFAKAGISQEVQHLYSTYCKFEYPNWDKSVLFDHGEVRERTKKNYKNSPSEDSINFFNSKIPICSDSHIRTIEIDRNELFYLIYTIYEDHKNEPLDVLRHFWVELYNCLEVTMCISMETKTGANRTRKPYSAFAKLVNNDISPERNLGKDWHRRMPNLNAKDKTILTSIKNEIMEKIESFIQESSSQNRETYVLSAKPSAR